MASYNPLAPPPRYGADNTQPWNQPSSQASYPSQSQMPPATAWPVIPTAAPAPKQENKEDDISSFFNSLMSPPVSSTPAAPVSTVPPALPPSYSV